MKITKDTSKQTTVEKSVIGECYKIGHGYFMRVHNTDLVGYAFVDLSSGRVSSHLPSYIITSVTTELHVK